MTVPLRTTIVATQSALQSTGVFPGGVVIGDLSAAPPDKTCSIQGLDAFNPGAFLSETDERRTALYRLMIRKFQDEEAAEFWLWDAYDALVEVLNGDLDLSSYGGQETGVPEVDVVSIEANWGNVTVDSTVFRTCDVRVPYIVHGGGAHVR